MNHLAAALPALGPAHILLVEDDEGVAELFQEPLQATGLELACVRTGRAAVAWLVDHPSALVLLDYSLPDMTAGALIESLARIGPVPPFIVITGHGDERVAVNMMKLGAQDYLVKDSLLLDRLPGVVQRVLREIRMTQQLRDLERTRLQGEQELRAIYDHTPTGILLLDRELRIRKTNAAAAVLFRRTPAEISGQLLGDALGCHNSAQAGCGSSAQCQFCCFRDSVASTLATGQPRLAVESRFTIDNQERVFLLSTIRLEIGDAPFALVCLEEITERKCLEEGLRQAHKLEAIGKLAGGVAHDFNNILAAMLMQLGQMRTAPDATPAWLESVAELERGANRAANLTRQLLLFGRRQAMQVKPLEVNSLLSDLLKMLKRILGEHISVSFNEAAGGLWVNADAGMLEQLVVNLCVNSRDAMPKGGRLSLSTRLVERNAKPTADQPEGARGKFVCLTVADTGCGMDAATLKHIYEPFFTTKAVGQGTGLGLATVFGIVKQHGGEIEVSSEPGRGTTFQIHLPALAQNEPDSAATKARLAGGAETILLVEDDVMVRKLAGMCLTRQGYRVLEAESGPQALEQWHQHAGRVDLLLSDMVMPNGLTGLEVCEQLRQSNPNLKVILSSGYSEEMTVAGLPAEAQITFLAKPYENETLLATVRRCLDQEPRFPR